jgi:HEPN domain-containing protein
LADIDKLYSKAEQIRCEALRLKNEQLNYDLSIRRSQEALELYLKVIFKLVKQEYPKNSRGHELSSQIRAIYEMMKNILKDYGFRKEDIARLLRGNIVLASWRETSFYGEEKLEQLAVSGSFTKEEAGLAIDYAREAASMCTSIRDYFYKTVL